MSERPRAIDIPCPKCKAPAGQWCSVFKGKQTKKRPCRKRQKRLAQLLRESPQPEEK